MKDAAPRLALKLPPERNEELETAQVEAGIRESYLLIASKFPKALRQKYLF